MEYRNSLVCGGSLVTLRHVLTAAHCFYDEYSRLLDLKNFIIRAGSANYQRGGTTRTISLLILHPLYSMTTRDNDIAVLVLAKNLRSSKSIQPVALPRQGDPIFDDTIVWAVGWGTTVASQYRPPSTLQEVQIRTINQAVCAQNYLALEALRPPNEQYRITNNMVCSGLLGQGGKDACQGDSGGPLVYSSIVVGITSWGWDCAHPNFPGVNARTSSYTNWINQTVTQFNASPPVGSISGILLFASLISALLLGSHL